MRGHAARSVGSHSLFPGPCITVKEVVRNVKFPENKIERKHVKTAVFVVVAQNQFYCFDLPVCHSFVCGGGGFLVVRVAESVACRTPPPTCFYRSALDEPVECQP